MGDLVLSRKKYDLNKISIPKAIGICLVLIAFMDSFVVWNDTLGGKLFTYGIKFINVFAFLYLLQKNTLRKYAWALLVVPLGWYVWDESSLPASLQYVFSSVLPICSFILLKDEDQLFVLKVYLKLIALFFIPGIVIYVLINVIHLPHMTHVRSLDNRSYENYFFLCYSLDDLHYRFFSVFDEPGVVGSLATMVVFYYRSFLSKRQYIIYVIAGFLSMSLFFIIVFLPLYYFSNLRIIPIRKRVNKIFKFVGVIVFFYFAFIFVLNQFKDDPLVSVAVYNRFEWRNGLITGVVNNRDVALGGFDNAYESQLSHGGLPYLIGNGKNKVTENFAGSGLSYRIAIYEKGIIIALYALLLVVIMHPWRRHFIFSCISLLFLCSLLFQRPLLFKIDYFILIYTGVKLLSTYGKTEDRAYYPEPDEGGQ